ncbi:hypothetical protein AXF42_Ash002188 [Apostasia shenzhenica]|uniref:Uncharacterized protein n=1 Tax=Apostasia shenzhenica TaxID=1088818 RepID=A0A2I0AN19_9ASPA|nr:hypothetical protein AXF42_Ash002188 [Apostasia shenzhenica]
MQNKSQQPATCIPACFITEQPANSTCICICRQSHLQSKENTTKHGAKNRKKVK